MSLTLNRPDNGNLGAAQPLDGWSATGTSRGAAAISVGTGSAPLSPRQPESHTADSQFNSDVTCAQQALGFLDTAAVNLQSLKVAVSAKLGGRNIDQGQLEARLEQFTRQWADRPAATSASLDAQLALVGAGAARQSFQVRGLDLPSLQSGGAEILTFYPGGLSKTAVAVSLEPGLTAQAITGRLDKALSPEGIRVTLSAQGELELSVPELAFAGIADQLMIKGGGIRFPGGQPNRVRVEAVGGVIDPESWQVDDPVSMRQTLPQIIAALDSVQHARSAVRQTIDQAGQQIEVSSVPASKEWAETFASGFQSMLCQSPAYWMFSAVAPALSGISRQRVTALLS